MEREIEATKAKISHQFDDYKLLPYRLYAIFIHRGTVNFGHYWIYIFDFERNIWRKYNDTYVTEVQNPYDEIFKSQEDHNPPTPYFLVYVNDKLKERLASPVYRDIIKDQPPPAGGPEAAFWDKWDPAMPGKHGTEQDPPAYGDSGEGSDVPNTGGISTSHMEDAGTGEWYQRGADLPKAKW